METGADALRRTGLRNTAQRRTVLAVLDEMPHATAAQIAIATTNAGLSRQGLYNMLDDFTRVGLIRRIEPAGSAARYERRVGDNHHHVVCRRCGRVEDVPCAVGDAPCLEPSDGQGFAIDEAEVTWWGICAECAALATAPAATTTRSNTETGERRRV